MMMPATAPSTPASHDPAVLTGSPCSSYSTVSSPKYQTVPVSSAAYQSNVRSTGVPLCVMRSRTIVVSMPWINFVRSVTTTCSIQRSPSSLPRSVALQPGSSGK